MGILDRFKTQPKWKHPDPATRLAGVQELPEDEQDVLAEVARTDEDARVRRVAVSKLGGVAVLAEIMGGDADADVRDEAAGVLLDIALGAYEADEAASLAALDALGALPMPAAQKQLVLVAKAAQREAVSRAALDRLGADQRALGSVARRSEHASIREAALAALVDSAELAATASKSSFRETALGALERLTDPAAIRGVAARSVNQAAARRARAMLRAIEEQEAAAAAAEAARMAAIEARRKAQREIIREIESVAAEAAQAGAAERLPALEARWREEGVDADEALVSQFDAAFGSAREALARESRAREAREQQARETEAALAARRAIVNRVRALTADAPAEAEAGLQAEWDALPAVEHPEFRQLQADFEAALRGLERRRREAGAVGERIARAGELAAALETIAADEGFPRTRELRQRARRIRQDARAAIATLEQEPAAGEAVARVRAADEALEAREAAWRELQNAESEKHKRRAQQALQRMADLQKVESPTLKALDRALAEAIASETELEQDGSPDAERQALRDQLAAARAALQPRADELREADDWRRWANAGVQEQLIAQMEALAAEPDAALATRRMRELQAEWKTVAAAPRDRAEALWNRVRTAMQSVRERLEPARAEMAAQQAEHLARKVALCEQAAALAESTDWIATADALKALQAEWKTIGPAPRRDEQAIWERFRTACNRFFTRRQDDLKQRRTQWATNLEKKEALIARAEALASTTDWEAGFNELKALQAEWKATGPVKKTKSEAVWGRFRTACDAFMERYRNRDAQAFADRVAQRETLITGAETLAGELAAGGAAHDGLLERVRSLRTGWQQAGQMPRELQRPLLARFDAAIGSIVGAAPDVFRHTELDVETNRRQLESLCDRVEKLAARAPQAPAEASPVSVLAHQLREALAARTIGGRADEESRWKSSEYEVRAAQDAWQKVGFVPEPIAAPLQARFQRAVHRFYGDRRPRGRK